MTDRFELLEELGAGGMGSVWKARDTETGDIVALKLVHAHLARDPDYVARFEREVEVARRVDSPHVVKVLGYGTREGIPFMAMEYVEGQSLREVLKERGKLTWGEAKPIVRQVAEGLGAAHAAGIIHRDVKPSNILIAADGSAKLADFGIARALDMTRLTGSSTILGTPHYMAPDREVTPQSDLYSLGCVLYEMLTGRPPFDGETPQEVWRAHDRDTIQVAGMPREAGQVVGWLTRRDSAQRPRTAGEMAAALSGGSPRFPGRGGRGSRSVLAAAVTGFAALVLVGVGTALVLTGGDDTPPPVMADPTTSPRQSRTPSMITRTRTMDDTASPTMWLQTPETTSTSQVTDTRVPTRAATTTQSTAVVPTPELDPTEQAPSATVPSDSTDADGDGTANSEDWCPDIAGAWGSGCPNPATPFLSYALTSPRSFRLSTEVPYGAAAQPRVDVFLDGHLIWHSHRNYSPGDEGWYIDIYEYRDAQFVEQSIQPGTTYCMSIIIVYSSGHSLSSQTQCLTTIT